MTWANLEQSLGLMISTDADLGRMPQGFSNAHLFSSHLIQRIYLLENRLNHHADALNYVLLTQNCQHEFFQRDWTGTALFHQQWPTCAHFSHIDLSCSCIAYCMQLWIAYLAWLLTHILRGSHAVVHEWTTDGLLAYGACRKTLGLPFFFFQLVM